MNKVISTGALVVAMFGTVASVFAAVEVATVQSSLSRAESRLAANDVKGAASELSAITSQLANDSAAASKTTLQQVQFISVQLNNGDVSGAADQLHNLVQSVSTPDATSLGFGHGGFHPGPGPRPFPHPIPHPIPHPGPFPRPFPHGPGHHWPHPPVWWHEIPLPIAIPLTAISYNEGFNAGVTQGHYDGWNNLPYNIAADPYWTRRASAFQQGFTAGYAQGYANGQAGR